MQRFLAMDYIFNKQCDRFLNLIHKHAQIIYRIVDQTTRIGTLGHCIVSVHVRPIY